MCVFPCRSPHHAMTIRPKPLLIVDDDEGMRDTLGAILSVDYRVLTAPSAEDGSPCFAPSPVDLMLSTSGCRA